MVPKDDNGVYLLGTTQSLKCVASIDTKYLGFNLNPPSCNLEPLNQSVLTDSAGGIQLGSNQEFGSIGVKIAVSLFNKEVFTEETQLWFIGKHTSSILPPLYGTNSLPLH